MVASITTKVAAFGVSLGIIISVLAGPTAEAKSHKNSSQAAKGASSATKNATKSASTEGDDGAIRAQLSNMAKLLAEGDARALASLWTADGEYIDEDGARTSGQKAIEQRFQAVFTESGKPKVDFDTNKIKFLSNNVALVEGTVERKDASAPVPASQFSLLFLKGDSGWQIMRASERPVVAVSNYTYLRDFDFLVGDWTAQRDGISVHMKAEWVPSKNFLLCKFDTKKPDGSQSIDMQIVGWDPRLEQPRSWHFDSSGGFGEGVWSKVNDQWSCEASGVESDGSTSRSTNVIKVIDKNTFAWSSINRSVDGVAIGDAPALEVQRTVR